MTFFRDSGGPVVRNFTLQPTSRLNVWVDQIPELANAAFSAFVEVTSGGAITAERSVYFGAGSWWEGTNSPGATSESEAWGFADGAAGNLFSTFVLVMNDSTSPLPLRGTFMREDGTGIGWPGVPHGRAGDGPVRAGLPPSPRLRSPSFVVATAAKKALRYVRSSGGG